MDYYKLPMNNKKTIVYNLGYFDNNFDLIKYLNLIFGDRFIYHKLIIDDFFLKKIHPFSGMILIELTKIFKPFISFLINKLIKKFIF